MALVRREASKKRKRKSSDLYLPQECWECVFKFLKDDNLSLKSLSLVSKQFLSITNTLKLSLTYPTLCILPRLFRRFNNVSSINLTCCNFDLNYIFNQISFFPFNKLTSLNISNQPKIPSGIFSKRLKAFSKNIYIALKGLTCIQLSGVNISDEFLLSIAINGLPLKKLGLQYCKGYTYKGIFDLISKSQHIQHLDLRYIDIDDKRVSELSLFLPDLVYVNFTLTSKLTELALIALVKNCPSLSEIVMGETQIGQKDISNSLMMDSVVSPQVKSLQLANNPWLRDENITMLASVFPNLQLLDLSHCYGISEQGIAQVLKRCRKIKQLKLAYCSRVNLLCGMNFQAPKLQVLNLSHTDVDDETLYVISKSCCGLLQLIVENCHAVTKKGVKHVLKNCVQLREINLKGCYPVNVKVVASMVRSRPSLRKITNKLVS